MQMTRKTLNVALLWHSAKSDNFGVAALTVSEIEILRSLARDLDIDLHMTIVDWKDPRTPYVGGDDVTIVPVGSKELFHPGGVLRILRQSDLVIDISGGDSFTDIYGPKRLNRLLYLKFLTHLSGKPMVVAPQTIGPFNKAHYRRIALSSLRRSALVATRDAKSTSAARDMGFDGPIIEASDVALRLPYNRPSRPENGPLKVGLNVSGLLMNGGHTRKNQFGLSVDYPGVIRRLIEGFLAHEAAPEVILVPHVLCSTPGAVEDDVEASQALAARYPEITVAPRFETPVEAKSFISGLDFFAGARMHACIAAFSSGVPVVPMAYSRKFSGLFGTLGYNWTVDCVDGDDETIVRSIFEAFDDRDILREEQRVALDRGIARMSDYEEGLRKLFLSTARAA